MSAKPDPYLTELLQCLVDIARTQSQTRAILELHRCANSSAGSNEPLPLGYFPPPTAPSSPTEPSSPPTGTSVSVLHTEDKWWTAQDRDPTWINQWDHDDENTDPKSWK